MVTKILKNLRDIIAKMHYENVSMKETLYLMSSKNNKSRLDNAVEQIEKSNLNNRKIYKKDECE